MKKLLLMFFALLSIGLFAQRIDINTASLAELMQLPITRQQAQDIYEYREYTGYYKNIFELRSIGSIDQQTLNRIRPLVVVSIWQETDDAAARRAEIRDLLERLDSNEGASEGMADVWEDFLMTPQNVNRMSFDDLISLPNVSPVDAVAVLRRVARGDTISDMRDLRNTVGISYYGYSNLRNYVYYKEPPVRNRLYFDTQLTYHTRYFEEGAYDMFHESMLRSGYQNTNVVVPQEKTTSYWGYFGLDKIDPDVYMKMRMRYGNHVKAGFMSYSAKGDASMDTKTSQEIIDDSKYYAAYENNQLPFLDNAALKLYLGHYRVTYGEGLVMENTDFYSARKTGYGFSKRILGITPDLSRTQEYALRGAAIELSHPRVGFSFWLSEDNKDAVIYKNPDGSDARVDDFGNAVFVDNDPDSEHFGRQYYIDADGMPAYQYQNGQNVAGKRKVFSYVNSTIRFSNEELEAAEALFNHELAQGTPYATGYLNLVPRKNIINEKLWGTHFQVSPFIGTKLGFTTYTALYDDAHFMVPDWNNLGSLLIRDSYYYRVLKMLDSEIAGMYSTQTSRYNRDYRRVIGFDAHTVIGNTSIQGEYAELSVDGEDHKLGDDPKAYLVSAYTQFENLYFLTLFRHYDLDFDNPYSNAFSEHEKLDDTILEKYIYALTNPLISDIFQNSSQAQPERGVYFETRYRFSNYFTVGRSYIDLFERLSDNRKTVRFQSELEFRPLFQLALRLRYKNQVNRYDDYADRGVSKTNEYTISTRTFLSAR
ncbi:MAG: helix-hairpin-helix domain-containing protein, partial [Candidatus Cloacimonadaceae bacterium]|nr:helix-hairpin-helix domain-containing protein [Candidatus Cloacimonadaceae bacterium]